MGDPEQYLKNKNEKNQRSNYHEFNAPFIQQNYIQEQCNFDSNDSQQLQNNKQSSMKKEFNNQMKQKQYKANGKTKEDQNNFNSDRSKSANFVNSINDTSIKENQMIIRFPENVAKKIHEQFELMNQHKQEQQKVKRKQQQNKDHNKQKDIDDEKNQKQNQNQQIPQMNIQITPKKKQVQPNLCKLVYDIKVGDIFQSQADVIDLPCIVESQKTKDGINFFKSNDISQMLLVHQQGVQEPSPEQAEGFKQSSKDEGIKIQKYRSDSGITDCTEQIRKKFFKQVPVVPKQKVVAVEQVIYDYQKELAQSSNKQIEGPKQPKRQYKKRI
ncbi:hypothetical protein PPERSA_00839 [Pseudocohnilembus persalinus]|uniref:TAFII55 protein conserved region domain-containing protein n=1 Tax=Pseudocohnilembus persalinus TaxID=266149 RepID=A0A0V0R785_PSEPJ|nr:hypothetical protein PPERSA_00839 [Pseudocohnilembus persalinus]|eukprot:KRX10359.1 hypothetical protein PPERSA_00839 [Pseudocohnilembus persalinus]